MTWIKLYRRFTRWEWFDKPEMVQLFVWMLLEASYTDSAWHGQTIKRGQLLTTEPAISEATGLSRQQIRTCIGRLIETKEIIRETIGKSTDKKTLITICRYDDYQAACADEQPTSNRQATDKQPTTDQPLELNTVVVKQGELKGINTNSSRIEELKNKNYSGESAGARVHTQAMEEFLSGQIALESFCANEGIDVDTCRRLAAEVLNDWELAGESHESVRDARSHMLHLIRIKINKKRNSNGRRNKSDVGTESEGNPLARARIYTAKIGGGHED